MALSREQVLRELELLPVWQVKHRPAPASIAPQKVAADAVAGQHAAVLPVPSLERTELLQPATGALPDQGRAASIMQMDWQGLQKCVAGCEACHLSKARTQTVFGAGDPNADWLIVGEAPDAEEDRTGEPFAGQAGELLDNMLAAITLKRGQNVYMANVLKCRASENHDLNEGAAMQCESYLKRQVALIKPKLIVALGEFTAQTLLESEQAIASMRGKLHDYQGVPVVVTYHPAYLLLNLADKAKAWEDLCLAKNTMLHLQFIQIPQS